MSDTNTSDAPTHPYIGTQRKWLPQPKSYFEVFETRASRPKTPFTVMGIRSTNEETGLHTFTIEYADGGRTHAHESTLAEQSEPLDESLYDRVARVLNGPPRGAKRMVDVTVRVTDPHGGIAADAVAVAQKVLGVLRRSGEFHTGIDFQLMSSREAK